MDSRLSPRAIVKAAGEVPICRAGDATRVLARSPIGHYYEIMETAVREPLVERKLIGTEEIRRQIEVLAGQPQLRFLVIATGTDGKLGRVVQRQGP